MASIYKKNNKWYIQYYLDNKKISRSSGLEATEKNKNYLKKLILPEIELKIARGEFGVSKKDKSFKKYAQKYIKYKENIKTYKELKNLTEKYIIPIFEKREIDEIKSSDIKDYVYELEKDKTPKTIRKYLTPLSGIFKLAIEDDIISKNPIDVISLKPHTKKEIEIFQKEEVNLILSKAEPLWFKNYLAIAFYTGMRIGEIIGLMIKDIDLKNKTISVNRTISNGKITTPKTKSSIRVIPIFSKLESYIENQLKLAKKENRIYLFSKNGQYFSGANHLRGNTTDGRWVKLLKKCNVEYRQIYSTRHTFITNMLNSGKLTITQIAKMVGHTNTQMIIQNYAKLSRKELENIDKNFDPFGEITTVLTTDNNKTM